MKKETLNINVATYKSLGEMNNVLNRIKPDNFISWSFVNGAYHLTTYCIIHD